MDDLGRMCEMLGLDPNRTQSFILDGSMPGGLVLTSRQILPNGAIENLTRRVRKIEWRDDDGSD